MGQHIMEICPRLVRMDRAQCLRDVYCLRKKSEREEESRLTKADLLERFAEKTGVQEETDSVLLS